MPTHERDGASAADVGRDVGGAVDAAIWSVDAGTCANGLLANETASLPEPTPPPMGSLGFSIAVSADGTRAVVGAPYTPMFTGAAWVYARAGTGWTIEATLLAAAASANDRFGTSVALSADGSRAIVGATRGSDVATGPMGYATVFARTGTAWFEEATLTANEPDHSFGTTIAISADGSRALLGAPPAAVVGLRAGSAHVFVRTGTAWFEETTFSDDYLGLVVALDGAGDRALVRTRGFVRVMARTGSTWALEDTLTEPSGSDSFGDALALDATGTVALVGAAQSLTGPGYAVVYRRIGTTWSAETTFVVPCGADGDAIGASVALSSDGTRAIIGAPLASTTTGPRVGNVWSLALRGGAWSVDALLRDSNGSPDETFGAPVAISGDGSLALAAGGGFGPTPGSDNRVLAFALRP